MKKPNSPRYRSAVDEAVAKVGGPTKASHICGVSNTSVQQWKTLGYIPRSKFAVLLAEASGVAVGLLAGLPAGEGPGGGGGRDPGLGPIGTVTTGAKRAAGVQGERPAVVARHRPQRGRNNCGLYKADAA